MPAAPDCRRRAGRGWRRAVRASLPARRRRARETSGRSSADTRDGSLRRRRGASQCDRWNRAPGACARRSAAAAANRVYWWTANPPQSSRTAMATRNDHRHVAEAGRSSIAVSERQAHAQESRIWRSGNGGIATSGRARRSPTDDEMIMPADRKSPRQPGRDYTPSAPDSQPRCPFPILLPRLTISRPDWRPSIRRSPRLWLERLDQLLDVEKRDVFPTHQLLDHIPDLLKEIASVSARSRRSGDCRQHRGDGQGGRARSAAVRSARVGPPAAPRVPDPQRDSRRRSSPARRRGSASAAMRRPRSSC